MIIKKKKNFNLFSMESRDKLRKMEFKWDETEM